MSPSASFSKEGIHFNPSREEFYRALNAAVEAEGQKPVWMGWEHDDGHWSHGKTNPKTGRWEP